MSDLRRAALRLAASQRADALAAVVLALGAIGLTIAADGVAHLTWAFVVAVVACSGAVAARRPHPVASAFAVGAGLLLLWTLERHGQPAGASLLLAAPPIVAYALGTAAGLPAAIGGAALLSAALQAGSAFNPLFEMITVGPVLAGRVVRSRQELSRHLERRNEELESERARFAHEAMRYERARIARELHDVVAHALSVVVVQAAAGQRLSSRGADASATFDAIAEAICDAQAELGRLGPHPEAAAAPGPSRDLARIEQLAWRASAAGSRVRYLPPRDLERLVPALAEVAYRVIQESLTNVVKHAPGAAVEIVVSGCERQLEVVVANEAPLAARSGLEDVGGGHGLASLRERVRAHGGTFDAGPAAGGGWRVTATLPGDRVAASS